MTRVTTLAQNHLQELSSTPGMFEACGLECRWSELRLVLPLEIGKAGELAADAGAVVLANVGEEQSGDGQFKQ